MSYPNPFLDDPIPQEVTMKLDEKFEAYHKENPKVFTLFRIYARQAKAAGQRKFGAKAIFERMRWEMSITNKDPEGYKLNNNYTSRYARLLVEKYPVFEGFFFFRKLHPDKPKPVEAAAIQVPENKRRWPWRETEIGGSFFIPGRTLSDISAAKSMAAKRCKAKFESYAEGGGVRILRVG